MASATAQELAVRTAVASVADAATLLEKVDSPGRLYAPLTKAQLRIDLGVVDSFLELDDTPAAYDSADIGRALIVKDDLSGLEFTNFNSDNWDTAYSWGDHAGLYDATGTAASTMSTHLGNFTHGDIATNKAHADTTHDYAYISGNDGATGITAAELEELSNGSQTTLHSHAGGGGTFLDLTDTPASYDSADIGKYVRVKDDLSGLEFVEGGGGAFLDLTDTPASYDSADIGKFVKIKDDLTGLEFAECAGGAGSTSRCSVYKTAQSIPSGSPTKVQCDTEIYDDYDEFDNVTNHQFTAKEEGYYHASAKIDYAGTLQAADNWVWIYIYKNAGAAKSNHNRSNAETYCQVHVSGDIYLEVGETISLYTMQSGGQNANVNGYLDIHKFDVEGGGGGAHTIASHSDTTATGAELNTLVGGGQTALHSHAGGGAAFVDLLDTPSSIDSNDVGKIVKVSDSLDLDFTDSPEVTDIQLNGHGYFGSEVDNGNSGSSDTINWTVGNKQKSTLTDNCTFTFTSPSGPCNLVLKLIHQVSGGATITWPSSVKWVNGVTPTLTGEYDAIDIVCLYYDGQDYFSTVILNFS